MISEAKLKAFYDELGIPPNMRFTIKQLTRQIEWLKNHPDRLALLTLS